MTTFTRPAPKPEPRKKKDRIARPQRSVPEQNPLEESEQSVVVDWLKLHNICFHHSPNGGVRHITTAMKLKRQGTSAGFPDLIILDPPPAYPGKVGAAIEMKRRKDSHTSSEQLEWLQKLSDRGWLTFVCKGADVALEILETCGYGGRKCSR
jgi:hypothetical protein